MRQGSVHFLPPCPTSSACLALPFILDPTIASAFCGARAISLKATAGVDQFSYISLPVVKDQTKRRPFQALAPALALLKDTSCPVIERHVVGEPSGQIIAAASQHGCDLVVLGTHGHTALGNLFMGSLTMRVIADSPIPVLMVK